MMRFAIISVLAAPALSTAVAAQAPAERDWSAALREDAQALHDDIAANHPGPVNHEDPGFAELNRQQLALALERARTARSYADYFFALREYAGAFNDGHVGFGAYGDTPNDYQWPGFLTRYDAYGDIVVAVTADAERVPVGAKLIGCDGMTAEAYAAATLGRMWGRWHLQSQRLRLGHFLFVHEGSRYIPRAETCRFAVGGEERQVDLRWRENSFDEIVPHLTSLQPAANLSFEARILDDGTRWYGIPSFNGDPQSPAGKALPPMIAAMKAERAELAAAPAIVLDLRGNGGGSSDWSRQIAESLWGRAALEALPPSDLQVDWRVSPSNLEAIERARERTGAAMSPEVRTWFDTTIAGLRGALARGDQLWRHPSEETAEDATPPDAADTPVSPLSAPVYFVTDAACGSACLDAVDLWRALGAVHVGQTTSADTLYMETRRRKLPSGITGVSLPMKVYRGRPRKSNEPAVPVHIFDGDIGDTEALERWLATLRAPAASRPGS